MSETQTEAAPAAPSNDPATIVADATATSTASQLPQVAAETSPVTSTAETEPAPAPATVGTPAVQADATASTEQAAMAVSDQASATSEQETALAAASPLASLSQVSVADSGFAIWHWDASTMTGSDALTSSELDTAASSFTSGDVIYITARDGLLQRAVKIANGAVLLLHVG